MTMPNQYRDIAEKLLSIPPIRRHWREATIPLAMSKKQTTYRHDVFISYSSREKDWVRGKLLTRIENAGLKAFIDYRDFTRGAPSLKEMERGIIESRKTLIILTPEYVSSEWCELENLMAGVLGPANRDLRMIPLLKVHCKKPLRLATLTHIDFTDGGESALAWRQLLTALGAQPRLKSIARAKHHKKWLIAHPYAMSPNFTGRHNERALLTQWLVDDPAHPVLVIRALGGFGKSALTWQWLTHDVDPAEWQRVVWWSFYESDATFDSFIRSALGYLHQRKASLAGPMTPEHIKLLLLKLQNQRALLVLDGFERELRAFGGIGAAYQGDEAQRDEVGQHDCISPLAETFLRTATILPGATFKVLVTTRLLPNAVTTRDGQLLAGCSEEVLLQMNPEEAVAFFYARGIRGTRVEIEEACSAYGYHPLSLRLLSGLIVSDPQCPGDIASSKRLDVSGDIIQRQHHVLQISYDRLTVSQQTLLGRIACFRSPVDYGAIVTIDGARVRLRKRRRSDKSSEDRLNPPLDLDADLRDLVTRGLLSHDTKGSRFDLHPIVRRYAYDRLAAPDRALAHTRLRDYFAAVPSPDKVACIDDLGPVIELYHHTVRAGHFDDARSLYLERLAEPLYVQLGACQLIVDLLRGLFPDGENKPPRLIHANVQAWTLNELANAYSQIGQPLRALPLYEASNELDQKDSNMEGVSIGLVNVAQVQVCVGLLNAAESGLRRSIALAERMKDLRIVGASYYELARLLSICGAHRKAETQLKLALRIFEEGNYVQSEAIVWGYRALGTLLRRREARGAGKRKELAAQAVRHATRAKELTDEYAGMFDPIERNYVVVHWLLGASYLVARRFREAEYYLLEAQRRCRRINMMETESDILVDLARLRAASNMLSDAESLAEEARSTADRCGYVLQGADAHLELASVALVRGHKNTAVSHAKEARRLATCGGLPSYTYKAAYYESGVLLNRLA